MALERGPNLLEQVCTGTQENLPGRAHVIRLQDVRVVEGLMQNCELTQAACLHLGDVLMFGRPTSNSAATFIFDGRCVRLTGKEEPLFFPVEQFILLSDHNVPITGFTIISIHEESSDQYICLPQLFDPERQYTLIDRKGIGG